MGYKNDALFISYMSGRKEMWNAASKSAIHDTADVLRRAHPEKYIAFKIAQKMGAM